MVLGKFTRYVPTDDIRKSDAEMIEKMTGYGVIFLKDKNGVDWYDAQSKLSPETMKVVFDDDNIIRSFSTDASMLNPVDMSVGEVKKSDVPEGFDIFGGWVFDGVKIVKREYTRDELITQAEKEKQSLLKNATAKISPLQDAVDMGVATKEEGLLLIEWKKYRISVNRIDTASPENIDWPKSPVTLTES
ncbi:MULTISPECIES: tail fiber assembly protein [Enterobacter cloacae complex]|uniref:tail fiber assembly protein n=1 Tax=Enterobacter cloacae complex TaxID=354276 RepID=UPI0007C84547|nr:MULTISPECIES: tail fiber assembly protein [Enterobacter cloacae complex]MCU2431938.1 tail fiber assembly protein [Enterobacter kobei]